MIVMQAVGWVLGAAAGFVAGLQLFLLVDVTALPDWVQLPVGLVFVALLLGGLWAPRILDPLIARFNANRHARMLLGGAVVLGVALGLAFGVTAWQESRRLAPYQADASVVSEFREAYSSRYRSAAVREEVATRWRRRRLKQFELPTRPIRDAVADLVDSEGAEEFRGRDQQEFWDRYLDSLPSDLGEAQFPRGDLEWQPTRFSPSTPPDAVDWRAQEGPGDWVLGQLTATWKQVPIRGEEPPPWTELAELEEWEVEALTWDVYRVVLHELHLAVPGEPPSFPGRWRKVDASVELSRLDEPLPEEFVRELREKAPRQGRPEPTD